MKFNQMVAGYQSATILKFEAMRYLLIPFILLPLLSCSLILKPIAGIKDIRIVNDSTIISYVNKYNISKCGISTRKCDTIYSVFKEDQISSYAGSILVYNNKGERLQIITYPCIQSSVKVLRGLSFDTTVNIKQVDTSISRREYTDRNYGDTIAYHFKPTRYSLDAYLKNMRTIREVKHMKEPKLYVICYWAMYAYKRAEMMFEQLRVISENTDDVKIILFNQDPNACLYPDDLEKRRIKPKFTF